MEKLLTMRDAAVVLNLSKKNGYKTVQRYIKAGKLPSVRLDKSVRIKDSDLQQFIDSRRKVESLQPDSEGLLIVE